MIGCVMLKRMLLVLSLLLPLRVLAGIDVYEFGSEQERERYQHLVDEMRCPKCQNQNLAGSDSPIAKDLRREIHRMIVDGQSDGQIVDFMVDRYGEFVLYRPRLESTTLVLWGLPVTLLLVGAVIILLLVRRRKRVEASAIDAGEQARLQALLAAARQREAISGDNNKPAGAGSQESER